MPALPAGRSPDFNPIEQLFAKLKALLRKTGQRSIAGLCCRIAALLDAFTPTECANYFRNAGYAPQQVEAALAQFSILSGNFERDWLREFAETPFRGTVAKSDGLCRTTLRRIQMAGGPEGCSPVKKPLPDMKPAAVPNTLSFAPSDHAAKRTSIHRCVSL